MALWRKNTALSKEEKELREDKFKKDIIRRESFYTGGKTYRQNEDIESASNRRAAGCYVPNF